MSSAKFEKMEISLNPGTKKILELLQQNLEKNGIGESIFKKVSETEKKGLSGTFLLLLEGVTGELRNRTSWVFPPQDIELDASAFVLFGNYQYYLNKVMEEMGISAKTAQSLQIEGTMPLLRSLLLRIAAIALKVKIDDADHGEKVIQCLNDFVTSINESEILIEKGWFSNRLTDFGIQLATTHDDWIAVFTNMVKIIKAIHLPITTISEMITFLTASKYAVARHIILRSEYPVKEMELSDNWMINTFRNFEKKYSAAMGKINSDENPYTIATASLWNAEKFNNIHTEIFNGLKENKNISHQKIKELFEFFNKTNLLSRIARQIQSLIKIGGWMPIINGLIKIDNLNILFSKYLEEYQKIIRISASELKANSKNSAYHELIKYKNPNIVLYGVSIINHINLLNSPFIKEQICDVIGNSVSQLMEVNGEIQSLIDPEKTFSGGSLLLGKTSQGIAPESNNKSLNRGTKNLLQRSSATSVANTSNTLTVRSSTATTPATIKAAPTIAPNEVVTKLNTPYSNKEITLENFNRLVAMYKTQTTSFNTMGDDTSALFNNVRSARNNQERGVFVSNYMKTREKNPKGRQGRFYKILMATDQDRALFTSEEPEEKKGLANNLAVSAISSASSSSSSTTSNITSDNVHSSPPKLSENSNAPSETSEYHSNVFYEEKRKKALEVLKKSRALDEKQETTERTKESKEKTLT